MSDSPDAVAGETNDRSAGGLGLSVLGRAPRSPDRRREQPRLVAEPARPEDPPETPRRGRPHGRGLRLRRGVPDPRPRRPGEGRRRGADDLAGVVAGRLRPLRAARDPDGVALRRDVPRRRRPRRPGRRHAALRAAEQLAGQSQPRQGAPAALAGEEEVRPHDLLGRPDDLRGQPSAGDDGLHDLRLRRRPGRTSGSPTTTSTGVPSAPGSATSATAASGSWTTPWPPTRWASSTSTRRARTPSRTRSSSARDIRETFRRMGMNDEETVALIAGGHTFGKTHGAADPEKYLGPEPEGAPLEEQGLGWKSSYGTGKGADAITSGLEGTWTPTPTRWDNSFFETLFGYEWDLELSPAGLWQWIPRDGGGAGTVPDAHDPSKTHAPTILTTDLALRVDPVYEPIARRFLENPDQLADAFARVWFKLTHLDMGPIQRYLGPLVPQETLLWQDPVPAVDHELVGRGGHRRAQDPDPRLRAVGLPARLHRVGVGVDVPHQRQARRGERGAHPPRAAAGLGGQRPRHAGAGAAHPGGDPGVLQQRPDRGHEDLAGRPHRARRGRRGRAGRPRPPATTSRSPSLRDARTPRRSGPMRSPSPRSSRPRTGSATTAGRAPGCRRSTCWSTGRTC